LAKIFLSIYLHDKENDVNKIFRIIKSNNKDIKYIMGNKLNSKYVPDIKFFLDNEYILYDKINKLIKDG